MKSYIITGYKILLVCFILFILVFWFWYGKNDLFVLPFNSGVWGTASDWVMIAVTGVTAYFLWKTLQSQNDILIVERNANRLRIMPDFSFEEDSSYKITLKLNENPATIVDVIPSIDTIGLSYDKEVKPRHLFFIYFAKVIDERDLHQLALIIKYKDLEGNLYFQKLELYYPIPKLSNPKHILI